MSEYTDEKPKTLMERVRELEYAVARLNITLAKSHHGEGLQKWIREDFRKRGRGKKNEG